MPKTQNSIASIYTIFSHQYQISTAFVQYEQPMTLQQIWKCYIRCRFRTLPHRVLVHFKCKSVQKIIQQIRFLISKSQLLELCGKTTKHLLSFLQKHPYTHSHQELAAYFAVTFQSLSQPKTTNHIASAQNTILFLTNYGPILSCNFITLTDLICFCAQLKIKLARKK